MDRRQFLLALLVLGGCASEEACDTLRGAAVDHVLAVVDGNRQCEADADCAVIGLSGSCFDVCTRAVRADSIPAVEQALVEAEAWCEQQGPGCEFFVPPCAPPTDPVCRVGLCE